MVETMDFRLTWAKQPLWRRWEAQAKRGSCPSYATMQAMRAFYYGKDLKGHKPEYGAARYWGYGWLARHDLTFNQGGETIPDLTRIGHVVLAAPATDTQYARPAEVQATLARKRALFEDKGGCYTSSCLRETT